MTLRLVRHLNYLFKIFLIILIFEEKMKEVTIIYYTKLRDSGEYFDKQAI